MTRLSEAELDLVRAGFREMAAGGPEVTTAFYDRLFALEPGLRRVFPQDLEQQGTKLMSMLGAIVAQLHDHALLAPLVRDMARRHVAYGARPEHYAAVGEALIWACARRFGEGFGPAQETAWRRAYDALAAMMTEPAAA